MTTPAPQPRKFHPRRSAAFALALLVAVAPAPSMAQTKPAKSAATTAAPAAVTLRAGDWTAVGEGKAGNAPGSFVADAKKSLLVSNAALTQKAYAVTGEFSLKSGASVRINFNNEPAPAKRADPRETGPQPLTGMLLDLDKDGKMLRLGTQKWTPSVAPDAAEVATPFTIFVNPASVVISVGAMTDVRQRDAGQAVDLSFALINGAEVRGLNVSAISDPAAATMLPLVDISRESNIPLTGDAASVVRLKEVPRGLQVIDGVPFYFSNSANQGMDVSASMRGVKDPFKNKANFYWETTVNNNGRVVLAAPGEQYSAMHVIAFSAGRADHVPRMTVRAGVYGGAVAILEDVVVEVPTLGTRAATSPTILASIPVTLADGKAGYLHHVRVPMAQTANIKEFGRYSIEFTRDMSAHTLPPDPNEFGKIPAGMPSDVVVLATTLEPAPVTMRYVTEEAGNVFYETQKAVFKTTVTNRSDKPQEVRVFASATGPGTAEEGLERKTVNAEQKTTLAPGESRDVPLDVTPGKRGWFACNVGVESGGRVLQQRDTTMAVLAPDTRKAREDSPFGVWEFWVAHNLSRTTNRNDALASLIKKGGWRWTYGGLPMGDTRAEMQRLSEQYLFKWSLNSPAESYQRGAGWFDEEKFKATIVDQVKNALSVYDPNFKVMHESRSSTDLLRRFSHFLGGDPYAMPEAEKAKLEAQFENVKKYCLALKAIDPRVRIVLINDYPMVADQFLQRGFPKEAFDVIGLEGAMFMRSPERQPDWMSLLGNMQQIKRSQAAHGYNKPVWTTEALYHGTEAGNLSLHQQGTIAVREAMLALQLGVERMAAAGCIKDPSDDYHWSNWGSGGFCFRDPELNPKPSYAMYAWLTQIIDQAKPAGKIATPNTSLHVIAFKKPDGTHVYGVWTANGAQSIALKVTGSATIFDAYGNATPAPGDTLKLTATTTQQFITGVTIDSVASALPVLSPMDQPLEKPLIDFDKPDAFKVVEGKNPVLDNSWATPLIKGQFDASFVQSDGASVMKVTLKPDTDARKLYPRYVEYQLNKPITLEDRPYQFALRVKGNSGWAQMVFEVVDAKGRVWTSSGNQYQGSANAADPLGESFVSFEGWKTMTIPIVGMYPGKDQSIYWPKNYNWWPINTPEEIEAKAKVTEAEAKQDDVLAAYEEALAQFKKDHEAWEATMAELKAAGKKGGPKQPKEPVKPGKPAWRNMGLCPVDYPLKLTKIIVLMRPHILYVEEERPVANPTIEIDALGVTAPPPGM